MKAPGSGLLEKHPELVLRPDDTLREALEAMTRSRVGFAVVVDKRRRLLGVFNDADVRKALLRGAVLDGPVSKEMNSKPFTVDADLPAARVAAAFREHPKSHMPIVDAKRRLVGIADRADYEIIGARRHENLVVIMAGGLGKRLGPLTDGTPKPMLPVGDKPILELLLEQFKLSGFQKFLFAVNHLAEQVVGHFGDGSRWGVDIGYLRERKPLGTVGALSLLRAPIEAPVIVANGDILTKVNFSALLDFHKAEKATATLCVKSHEVNIPYGVVEIDGGQLESFVEKPVHRTYVNAGIYVLEPRALRWIPSGRRCDMPDLIAAARRRRKRVACFPIQEYWIDIGEAQAYQRAAADYRRLFLG
ncbi:MAG: nucleotidyltransferase family protein [Elusimicrobia bacterium]|nr:nucleotidyltransferase family protein [Elusimicrobiota bacterium]